MDTIANVWAVVYYAGLLSPTVWVEESVPTPTLEERVELREHLAIAVAMCDSGHISALWRAFEEANTVSSLDVLVEAVAEIVFFYETSKIA